VIGALAIVGGALAHPVGQHVVQHDLALEVEHDIVTARYQTIVPAEVVRRRPPNTVAREMASGLVFTQDTDGTERTLSVAPVDVRTADDPHGLQVDVTFALPLPLGRSTLAVSNGNLPETRSVFRTVTRIAPGIRVADSSLFVWHDGALARSEEGRVRTTPAARRTDLTLDVASGPIDRLHRTLQTGPFAAPTDAVGARWTSPLRTNQSRPWMLFAPLLGGVGVLLPSAARDRSRVRLLTVGLVLILIGDLAGPARFSAALALVALVSAIAGAGVPAVSWWVAPALVASLDLWGLALPTLAVQAGAQRVLGTEDGRVRPLVAIGVVLGALQLVRALG
jgi:hypothetical protein